MRTGLGRKNCRGGFKYLNRIDELYNHCYPWRSYAGEWSCPHLRKPGDMVRYHKGGMRQITNVVR